MFTSLEKSCAILDHRFQNKEVSCYKGNVHGMPFFHSVFPGFYIKQVRNEPDSFFPAKASVWYQVFLFSISSFNVLKLLLSFYILFTKSKVLTHSLMARLNTSRGAKIWSFRKRSCLGCHWKKKYLESKPFPPGSPSNRPQKEAPTNPNTFFFGPEIFFLILLVFRQANG